MKRIALVVLVVLVPTMAHAQSIWVAGLSQYVTDHGLVLHDGPVVQADITWLLPGGAYADVWVSQGYSEIDYTFGWGKCMNVCVDVNVSYFDLEPLWEPTDVIQTTAKFSLPQRKVGNHAFSPYVVANHVYSREDADKYSGQFFRVGLSDAWSVGERTTISQNAWLLHDSGVFQGESGFIGRYELSVGVKRGDYTFQPLVRVSVPFVSDRDTQLVAGFKISR